MKDKTDAFRRRPFPPAGVLQPVQRGDLLWLEAAPWRDLLPDLRAVFSTRRGGVGKPPFQQQKFGRPEETEPGDGFADMHRFLAAALPPGNLFVADQVHGRHVALVPEATPSARQGPGPIVNVGAADGLATRGPGNFLLIFVADCVPLLLAGPDTGALAVLHAGWRGTVQKIGPAAVHLLARQFGQDPAGLHVVIGPSIGPCCYEVDGPVIEAVERVISPASAVLYPGAPGKAQLDLWQANRLLLQGAGVPAAQILTSNLCTACHPDLFYSYRRERGQTGRLALAAGWSAAQHL